MKLNVYSDCDMKSPIIGTAPINFISDYDEEVNGWYRIGNAWLSTLDRNNKYVIKKTTEQPKGEIEFFNVDLQRFGIGSILDGITDGFDIGKLWGKVKGGLENTVNDYFGGDILKQQNLNINSISGVLGAPYQFLPWIDQRVPDGNESDRYQQDIMANAKSFGRKYAEKIANRMPILIMAPGDPLFLGGANKKETESLLNSLANLDENIKTIGQRVTSDPAKYYGFEMAAAEYRNYVNAMCWAAAVNMGLVTSKYDSYTNDGEEITFMGPENSITDSLREGTDIEAFTDYTSKRGFRGAVAFYVNSDTQISESIANSTSPSMLAESINQVSNMAREVQFLLGSSGGVAGRAANSIADLTKDAGAEGGAFDTVTAGLAGRGGILNTISKSMGNIMAGGKMIFPEIWSDSQFSRDYQVSIKLTSPDNDELSLYHNIIVPLCHLLAFALPRGSSTNSYVAPFLVRAAYKSFFSIDMGIVTSMSITKGGEGCWNRHGIPTQVEVQVGFKELYGIMNMAQATLTGLASSSYNIQQNDMLLTYLANMCGVNLVMSDISRNIIQQFVLGGSGFLDKAMSIDDAIADSMNTRISNMGFMFQK